MKSILINGIPLHTCTRCVYQTTDIESMQKHLNERREQEKADLKRWKEEVVKK